MNYADFGMGTWHPKTGMFDVVRVESLARELELLSYQPNIEKIIVKNKTASNSSERRNYHFRFSFEWC
jgi:phytoene desaturase